MALHLQECIWIGAKVGIGGDRCGELHLRLDYDTAGRPGLLIGRVKALGAAAVLAYIAIRLVTSHGAVG